MDTKNTITKTEVQGIDAKDLLGRLDKIESGVQHLKENATSTPTTTLLNRKEVASMLNISLPTVHSWLRSGILKAYRIGNRIRFKEQEVLEALNEINARN